MPAHGNREINMTVTLDVAVQVPEGLTEEEAQAVAYTRLVAGSRSFVLVGPNGPWAVKRITKVLY